MSKCSTTVLLTGATGFLGKSLLQAFLQDTSLAVVVATRRTNGFLKNVVVHPIADLDASTSWNEVFQSPIDIVVHSAARVHVMEDCSADPLGEYRRVNVEGTLSLARAAIEAGVKRFIFISSIKVNGESTEPGFAFSADDAASPLDPYGVSKMEAEQGLQDLARNSDLEVVIIRPVLIYGPGVGANFRTMMKWISRRLPLPLGAVDNKRSLVSIFNLVDFIQVCLTHPEAANEVFLVSDGEDISVSELLRRISHALGVSALLVPVPVSWMLPVAKMLGKQASSRRLLSSLQVDIAKNYRLLGWKPPVPMDKALQLTVQYFNESSK